MFAANKNVRLVFIAVPPKQAGLAAALRAICFSKYLLRSRDDGRLSRLADNQVFLAICVH